MTDLSLSSSADPDSIDDYALGGGPGDEAIDADLALAELAVEGSDLLEEVDETMSGTAGVAEETVTLTGEGATAAATAEAATVEASGAAATSSGGGNSSGGRPAGGGKGSILSSRPAAATATTGSEGDSKGSSDAMPPPSTGTAVTKVEPREANGSTNGSSTSNGGGRKSTGSRKVRHECFSLVSIASGIARRDSSSQSPILISQRAWYVLARWCSRLALQSTCTTVDIPPHPRWTYIAHKVAAANSKLNTEWFPSCSGPAELLVWSNGDNRPRWKRGRSH